MSCVSCMYNREAMNDEGYGKMNDPQRHQREMQATLEQIRSFGDRASKEWRLDIPVWKLSVEGIGMFLVAFMTGLGMGVIFRVLTG